MNTFLLLLLAMGTTLVDKIGGRRKKRSKKRSRKKRGGGLVSTLKKHKTAVGAAVGAAAEFADSYLKPMAERAYGDAALAKEERKASALARWIVHEQCPMFNARKTYRETKPPGIATSKDV